MNKLFLGIISLFVLTPAFAFAQSSTTTQATVNIACVQSAIEKRENAIIAAHDTFNASIKSALLARKDALKAAWGQTDKTARQTARNAAWTTFKTSQKDAHNVLRGARQTTWNTFSSEMKGCGVKNAGEEKAVGPQLPTSLL